MCVAVLLFYILEFFFALLQMGIIKYIISSCVGGLCSISSVGSSKIIIMRLCMAGIGAVKMTDGVRKNGEYVQYRITAIQA